MGRPVTLSISLTAALAFCLLAGDRAAAAETTRQIRAELPADAAARFVVENLAGTMKVVPGKGRGVVAVATVHAESEDLAESVRFERVTTDRSREEADWPTLRVRYPLDSHATIRYPRSGDSGVWLLGRLIDIPRTRLRYDGHEVTVSVRSGAQLHVDVAVEAPAGEFEATFRNIVGRLQARGISGRIKLDTHSGDIDLEKVRGRIVADTGSGDVKAAGVEGTLHCDTGSGDFRISDFHGVELVCDTGSGNVTVHGVKAKRLCGDTGSGNVGVYDSDLEEFVADTGSGNVALEARSVARLVRIKADTGSGNVVLRLGPGASFEAIADQGSGDIRTYYRDAEPIMRHKELVGYRRGDGRIRISVDTGSGDLTLDPGRVSEDRDRPAQPDSNRSR